MKIDLTTIAIGAGLLAVGWYVIAKMKNPELDIMDIFNNKQPEPIDMSDDMIDSDAYRISVA